MGQYVVRRLLAMVPTLFALSLFIFFVMRIMPGDVAMLMLAGPDADQSFTEEQLEAVRERLGLNDPLPVQYVNWVGDLLFEKGGNSRSGRTNPSTTSSRHDCR